MAKYPTIVATLTAITTRKRFGTALANIWVTELMALQRDIASTLGSFSTMASLFSISRKRDGTFKPYMLSHGMVYNVSASQHHNKLHASTHYGMDIIRDSNDSQKGLMTISQRNRLNSFASNATKDYTGKGSYAGLNWSTQDIALGFRPKFVTIFDQNISYSIDAIRISDTVKSEIVHYYPVSAGNAHIDDVGGGTYVSFIANGFRVWGAFNTSNTFHYFYIG